MSYIFISHYLDKELDCDSCCGREEYKEIFTRSIRTIVDGPDEGGWIRTNGYGGKTFLRWWIDPIEYPELEVVYI